MSGPQRGYPAEEAEWNLPVPPFRYNPSGWEERIRVCLLAFVAFLIASYMALYQWRLIAEPWDPVFGEQTRKVLDSDVAEMMHGVFGIPDAAMGAFAYLGDVVLGLAGSTRRWQYRPWLVLLFGLDVILLSGVSVLLVLAQATVVGDWCYLCLVTAAISVLLIYLAYDEVYISLKYLYRVWRATGSLRLTCVAMAGYPLEATDRVAAEMLHASGDFSASK